MFVIQMQCFKNIIYILSILQGSLGFVCHSNAVMSFKNYIIYKMYLFFNIITDMFYKAGHNKPKTMYLKLFCLLINKTYIAKELPIVEVTESIGLQRFDGS